MEACPLIPAGGGQDRRPAPAGHVAMVRTRWGRGYASDGKTGIEVVLDTIFYPIMIQSGPAGMTHATIVSAGSTRRRRRGGMLARQVGLRLLAKMAHHDAKPGDLG